MNNTLLASTTSLAVLGVDPYSRYSAPGMTSYTPGNTMSGNIAATWLAACGLNLSVTYWSSTSVNRSIDNFFDALRWGRVQPSMIYVAEARGVKPIIPADQARVDAHAADIAQYVSAGGGLFVPSQLSAIDGGTHFGFMATMAPYVVVKNSVGAYSTPALTADGSVFFPALSSAALSGQVRLFLR